MGKKGKVLRIVSNCWDLERRGGGREEERRILFLMFIDKNKNTSTAKRNKRINGQNSGGRRRSFLT